MRPRGGAVFPRLWVALKKRLGPIGMASLSLGATPPAQAQLPGFPGYSPVLGFIFAYGLGESLLLE